MGTQINLWLTCLTIVFLSVSCSNLPPAERYSTQLHLASDRDVYYLPKTLVRVSVEIESTTFQSGHYTALAEKRGIYTRRLSQSSLPKCMNDSEDHEQRFALVSASIMTREGPDLKNAFVTSRSALHSLVKEMTPSPSEAHPNTQQTKDNNADSFDEFASTLDDQALGNADPRGQLTGVLESIKRLNAEIGRLSDPNSAGPDLELKKTWLAKKYEALSALVVGKIATNRTTYEVDIAPDAIQDVILGAFDRCTGFDKTVTMPAGAGVPLVLTFKLDETLHDQNSVFSSLHMSTTTAPGFFYRMPELATLSINQGDKEILARQFLIWQFGTTENYRTNTNFKDLWSGFHVYKVLTPPSAGRTADPY